MQLEEELTAEVTRLHDRLDEEITEEQRRGLMERLHVVWAELRRLRDAQAAARQRALLRDGADG